MPAIHPFPPTHGGPPHGHSEGTMSRLLQSARSGARRARAEFGVRLCNLVDGLKKLALSGEPTARYHSWTLWLWMWCDCMKRQSCPGNTRAIARMDSERGLFASRGTRTQVVCKCGTSGACAYGWSTWLGLGVRPSQNVPLGPPALKIKHASKYLPLGSWKAGPVELLLSARGVEEHDASDAMWRSHVDQSGRNLVAPSRAPLFHFTPAPASTQRTPHCCPTPDSRHDHCSSAAGGSVTGPCAEGMRRPPICSGALLQLADALGRRRDERVDRAVW